MNFWIYPTGVAALIFCGTSVVFTIGLWVSIPSAEGEPLIWGITAGGLVAGLTAAALELCKFSFAPLGLWLKRKGRSIGNVLLILWPFLVLISIAATVGFLESNTTKQQQSIAVNSAEYQALKQQLNSYNRRINNINEIITGYKAGNFKKVALETDERLDELEENRDKTLAQLKAVQGSTANSAQAAFTGWATLTHLDPQKLQHSAFLALAVITDLVGLIALLAFNSALNVYSNHSLQSWGKGKNQHQGKCVSEEVTHTTMPENSLSELQQELAERIMDGEFGARPVLRKLNDKFKGGNNFVRPVFEYLLLKGEIKRKGKGFILASYDLR
ncbi:hypothetical protein [Microbulbifer sp. GL-2]|uniref:hypothetical protein n=1 Tax=Microbulbifer sp. GL-2 TaxID=2591606 RepID=UPI00116332B6|nr:hypothetical protein [Microbulbifer sp. GL-2]BBM04187.1 hypothetical protein GL2_42610 [Microbulbifer sp. GL-2]